VTITDSNLTGQDFGNRARAVSISGTKFNDANGNGARDADEPGLSGWTINLAGPDGSTSTATTGQDGSYSFNDLAAGTYTISEVQQSGWNQTFPTDGIYTVTLQASNETGKDFGNRARTYAISGTKFNDLNGNGARDDDEPGFSEWTINLDGPAGQLTEVTGPDGAYSFENLTLEPTPSERLSSPAGIRPCPLLALTL
jgi:hypothetical protein